MLRMHKPPLTTIEALEKEIPYYVTQLQIYAETALDAAPAVIAGLGGMRYGLDKGNQKARERIWALYHPSDLVKGEDTEDIVTTDLGAIAGEGNWSGDYKADSQSSDGLFSTESDHQQTKPNGEPKVQHGEDGLSAESLNTLKKEEVEHSKHKTIDQGQKAIQQTPGPQHQRTPSTTVETSGLLPLDTKAVPECKQDLKVTEDDTKTKGSQIGAKEISPTTEIGKVKVYEKNPKIEDDNLKII